MTSTPLDLTPLGGVLTAIGWLYWLIALAILAVAWWLPKVLWQRIAAVSIAMAAVYLVFVRPVQTRVLVQQQQHQASNVKLDEAKALFNERCKGAGERVTRTVESVDGLLLTNTRPKEVNYSEQFKMDDPYGRNCGGDDCIALYLFDYKMVPTSAGANPSLAPVTPRLYAYVDVVDDATSQRLRYTKESASSPLTRNLASGPVPRYGVTWADVSTRDDREHWIAGGSIKVVDLETKEVIAERIGYLIDPGQGSMAGDRSPWTWARSYSGACPPIDGHNQTFVSKVLKPKHRE
jgi:hypothetical protein